MPITKRESGWWLGVVAWLLFQAPPTLSQGTLSHVRVTPGADSDRDVVTGRVIVKAQDGGLLIEDRSGRYTTLTAASVGDITTIDTPFQLFSADELATHLLTSLKGGFAIHHTKHFVICSDASERYTDYCGRLLEQVCQEYFAFWEGSTIEVSAPLAPLPVIIFGRNEAFQAFATNQHPGTDFSDCPGYYSVRDNQMLISAISGDRDFRTNSEVIRELRKKPRQVETIVHEAVHQLAFNTGLQTRFADNPMWLSEGLAVYFEGAPGRGSLIWSRPGERSRLHLAIFKDAAALGKLRIPLSTLLSGDQAFQSPETTADAYATSWALTWFLSRTDRAALDALLASVADNRPLRLVSPEDRLRQVAVAVDRPIQQLEADLIRYMSRIR